MAVPVRRTLHATRNESRGLEFQLPTGIHPHDVARRRWVGFDDSAWKTVSLPHTWTDNKFREWISTRNDKQSTSRRRKFIMQGLVSKALQPRSELCGAEGAA